MTTIREYFLLLAFLLALAVTGYVHISKLLVRVSERTVAQLEVKRR